MKIFKNWRLFSELLFLMTEKELRTRYKYTFFGFLWLVLNPVLQMILIGFVFSFFIKSPIENYYYYLFIGLLIWNFFSLSLSKTTPSIVWERNLIKKSYFPRAVIPLSIILSNLVHLLIAFVLFTISILFLLTPTISGVIYILLAFILLILFTVGISLLTSALNVRYRDVNFIVQAILIMWFYATPIIYDLSMIPSNFYWIWKFNPMTSILQLLQHGFLNMQLPEFGVLSFNIVIIFTIFLLGITAFNKESKNFDDWL